MWLKQICSRFMLVMLWAALKENETSHLSSPSNADLCQSLFLRNCMNPMKQDLVSKNRAFYLHPHRQGIILPQPRNEMKGDLSFALCLCHLWACDRGPSSFLIRFKSAVSRDPDSKEPPLQVILCGQGSSCLLQVVWPCVWLYGLCYPRMRCLDSWG